MSVKRCMVVIIYEISAFIKTEKRRKQIQMFENRNSIRLSTFGYLAYWYQQRH